MPPILPVMAPYNAIYLILKTKKDTKNQHTSYIFYLYLNLLSKHLSLNHHSPYAYKNHLRLPYHSASTHPPEHTHILYFHAWLSLPKL